MIGKKIVLENQKNRKVNVIILRAVRMIYKRVSI